MSLLNQIKQAQIEARKQRRTAAAASLTTLFSEASMIGKNDGGRETTDTEVIAVIKKFVKNIDEVIRVAGDYRDSDRVDSAWDEKTLLESFLPKQMTDDEITAEMQQYITANGLSGPKAKGLLLRDFKQQYEGLYDGAKAAAIASELLK